MGVRIGDRGGIGVMGPDRGIWLFCWLDGGEPFGEGGDGFDLVVGDDGDAVEAVIDEVGEVGAAEGEKAVVEIGFDAQVGGFEGATELVQGDAAEGVFDEEFADLDGAVAIFGGGEVGDGLVEVGHG
jgi:hypothetical protein